MLKNQISDSMDSDAAPVQVKVIDYGLAAMCETAEETLTFKCGSPGYVAPEILKG